MQVVQELNLQSSLTKLIQDNALVTVLIDNLSTYVQLARGKLAELGSKLVNIERKKINLVSPKYTHHEEVDERLQFLKYVAQLNTEYQISQADLGRIYDLLSKSSNYVIPSDYEEFLIWCKSSCEQSTAIS